MPEISRFFGMVIKSTWISIRLGWITARTIIGRLGFMPKRSNA